ncbi:hypothetical protein [Nannocystis exedens]|nr:hypothetical protein [Nannocystis exedens]
MVRPLCKLVIAAQWVTAACVARAPGETTAGDGSEATGPASTTGDSPGGTTGPASTSGEPPDPTTEAASSSGASTRGAGECALIVGPHDEPPEADPDGCFAVTDEAGCAAKGDACMALFGVPAECADSQWCRPDADAATFLACRPFTICKPSGRVVCVATDGGTRAFYTTGCMPVGFGPCEPGFDSPDSGPPPTCE